MNTAASIFRRSANRIPALSQAGMATMASNPVVRPLSTTVTNAATAPRLLPIRRSSPYIDQQNNIHRYYSASATRKESSPFAKAKPTAGKKKFVPRKAAVELTEKARTLFKKLLESQPSRDGILLNYNQSSSGQPRMVFSFSFVSKDELHEQDEGVSLEVDEEGNPKSPRDALDDGLPKLYVHHNAFLKVLGAKVDVDLEKMTPILYDKEGHELDANA